MNIPEDNYFDCLVFIGRFQPFHAGHLAVIRAGLERAALMVIICGSARQPRSMRNPWNDQEREHMIRGSLTQAENNRIHILPLMDNPYDEEAWARDLEQTINKLARTLSGKISSSPRIGLIGHNKNNSSYYPKLFRHWSSLVAPDLNNINATAIRDRLFGASDPAAAQAFLSGAQANGTLPTFVLQALHTFCATPAWAELKAEHDYFVQYRQTWSAAPYPPVFVTVDAVVVHGQQLLLIKRKNHPGKGLWALPGGFVNQDELLVDACVRELQEETAINLPAAELKSAIRSRQVFDQPYRSARGRTITQVFYFDLRAPGALPAISAGDDASAARWFSLADLDPATLNEDHYFIIRELTAAGSA